MRGLDRFSRRFRPDSGDFGAAGCRRAPLSPNSGSARAVGGVELLLHCVSVLLLGVLPAIPSRGDIKRLGNLGTTIVCVPLAVLRALISKAPPSCSSVELDSELDVRLMHPLSTAPRYRRIGFLQRYMYLEQQ